MDITNITTMHRKDQRIKIQRKRKANKSIILSEVKMLSKEELKIVSAGLKDAIDFCDIMFYDDDTSPTDRFEFKVSMGLYKDLKSKVDKLIEFAQ
jgi:hypothetical protein